MAPNNMVVQADSSANLTLRDFNRIAWYMGDETLTIEDMRLAGNSTSPLFSGNVGDYYLEVLPNDRARVLSGVTHKPVTADFEIHPDLSVVAADMDDDGSDEIYVESNGSITKFDLSSLAVDAWKKLPEIDVFCSENQCDEPGDCYSQNLDFKLQVRRNTLHFIDEKGGTALLATPSITLWKTHQNIFNRWGAHVTAHKVLKCVLQSLTDQNTRLQMQSAFSMLMNSTEELEEMEGPLSLPNTTITFSYGGLNVEITPGHFVTESDEQERVSAVKVNFNSGFIFFRMNRAGLIFQDENGLFTLNPLDDTQKQIVRMTFDAYLKEHKANDQQTRTVRMILDALNAPLPEWAE